MLDRDRSVSQNASVDPDTFAGVWAFSGTYGAFTR
jgi:hypothetical protein